MQAKPAKLDGIILIFIGVTLISSFLFWKGYGFYQKTVLSFNKAPSLSAQAYEGVRPSKIIIDSAKIDIPITQSEIVNGVWEISDSGASFLKGSSAPGFGGNIVIYGHNRRAIFGRLKSVKKDDEVRVLNENGEMFKYKVTEILTVNPDQIEVVSPTNQEVLTIYTCTGFLDSKRLVVKANPLI